MTWKQALPIALTLILVIAGAIMIIAYREWLWLLGALTGLGAAIAGSYIGIRKIQHDNLDLAERRLELARKQDDLDSRQVLVKATLAQMASGAVHPHRVGDLEFKPFSFNIIKQADPLGLTSGNGPGVYPDLLSAIIDMPNILIVGGKGSGKTTLLQWLAYMRQQENQVVILDSHDYPAKWPAGHVIGNGRNYTDIRRAMESLVDKMNRRYQELAAGQTPERGHPGLVNFIDEFTMLPTIMKERGFNIQNFSFPLLTEGRKVTMDTVWGAHSDRAAALGLQGAYDLMACFDAVVYLKHGRQGERWAEARFGTEKALNPFRLPGPFDLTGEPGLIEQDEILELTPNTDDEAMGLSEFDLAVKRAAEQLLAQGESLSQRKVVKAIYGEDGWNGDRGKKIGAALDRLNLI